VGAVVGASVDAAACTAVGVVGPNQWVQQCGSSSGCNSVCDSRSSIGYGSRCGSEASVFVAVGVLQCVQT
jgi:hypothetical protein